MLDEATTAELSDFWAVHSEFDRRPAFRAWARSEPDAQRQLEELRASDPEAPDTEYWIVRMTTDQVGYLRRLGLIPELS
jgi:hypothetical protein